MPKVSIIVPVYNVEKYIGRCIESIQKQTLTDWELILINDCSLDNSLKIIQDYAKKESRIIIKCHKENHGPMMARRWGDEIAGGEYITYCDGDDMMPENALQILYNAAILDNADLVMGSYTCINTNGERKDVIIERNRIDSRESLFKDFIRHQPLWGKLFKTDILKAHDYNVVDHMKNGEDAYMLYQMVPYINKVIKVQEIVYNYMQNNDSSSQRRYSLDSLESIMQVNSLRISLINDYPHLKKDLLRCVSDALNTLIVEGYDIDGQLSQLMEKYGLIKYSNARYIFATHPLVDSLKLIIRKSVLRRF